MLSMHICHSVTRCFLIVFTDISEGFLEDIVVADLELDVESLAKGLANFLISANG